MDFQSREWPLHELLLMIQTGDISLPEFQREFLWDPPDVADLVASVARRWPIGSIMVLEGPHKFRQKGFESGPEPNPGTKPGTLLVLDGQQRLTGLFHALLETSDTRYYIELEKLDSEADMVDAVRFLSKKEFQRRFRSVTDMAAAKVVTPRILFSDDDAFFSWWQCLPADYQKRALRERDGRLAGLRRFVYRVPGVLLSRNIELQALAKIFEKLNRTGVPLDTFDLMVASLYPEQFDLRREWEHAKTEHPVLKSYEVTGLELLRLIALLRLTEDYESGIKSKVLGVRQSDVLKLGADTVIPRWSPAVQASLEAIQLLSEFGVASALVPSTAMIFAAAAALDAAPDPAPPWVHELIEIWFWKSTLAQTYIQGVNTTVIGDARDLRQAVKTGVPPVEPVVIDLPSADSLLEPVVRNRILLRGLMAMLLITGARDPLTGTSITAEDEVETVALEGLQPLAGPFSRSLAAQVLCLKRSKTRIREATRLSQLDTDGLASQGVVFKDGHEPGDWVVTRSLFLRNMVASHLRGVSPRIRLRELTVGESQ